MLFLDRVDCVVVDSAAIEMAEPVNLTGRVVVGAIARLARRTDDCVALRALRIAGFDVGNRRLGEGARLLAEDPVQEVPLDFLDDSFCLPLVRSSPSPSGFG